MDNTCTTENAVEGSITLCSFGFFFFVSFFFGGGEEQEPPRVEIWAHVKGAHVVYTNLQPSITTAPLAKVPLGQVKHRFELGSFSHGWRGGEPATRSFSFPQRA